MERPSLTFKVEDTELRWTYGLQLDIQRIVPDAENTISSILSDPYTRDYLIRRALTPVKASVTDEKNLVQIEDIDLDPDQVLSLLEWISGHLLYFFLKSAKSLSAQGAEFKAGLPQTLSAPSTAGSEA